MTSKPRLPKKCTTLPHNKFGCLRTATMNEVVIEAAHNQNTCTASLAGIHTSYARFLSGLLWNSNFSVYTRAFRRVCIPREFK